MSRSPAEGALQGALERVAELEALLEAERSRADRLEAQRNHLAKRVDQLLAEREQVNGDWAADAFRLVRA